MHISTNLHTAHKYYEHASHILRTCLDVYFFCYIYMYIYIYIYVLKVNIGDKNIWITIGGKSKRVTCELCNGYNKKQQMKC